jgi:G3E family GTPase
MRTPVIVLTGIDPDAMAATLVGLSWDLPRAVAVRHEIDPERHVLTRTVSDVSGVLEREEIELEHACVSCALREDIVPAMERLGQDGRWASVVACLPVGAEAEKVGTVLATDARLQRHLRIAAVVVALNGESVVDDLLGDDLLRERGRHSGPDDARGVGEVGCAMAEYADVVVLTSHPDPTGAELVGALARPDATTIVGSENLEAAHVLSAPYDHGRTTAWSAPLLEAGVPPLSSSRVWRLELSSPGAFHPQRLLDGIGRLGGGRHRSRGAFWLPTRPGQVQVWDGSGGQLSIGTRAAWGRRIPRTRLLITGVGVEPTHLRDAFEQLLVAPAEALPGGRADDGFEPWLGAIRDIA